MKKLILEVTIAKESKALEEYKKEFAFFQPKRFYNIIAKLESGEETFMTVHCGCDLQQIIDFAKKKLGIL